MKRKIISLALALTMVLSLAPTVLAKGLDNFAKAENYSEGQFSDVSKNDWFSGSVKGAYELGLVKGSSPSTFNPNGNITVAEAIVLACRLHNIYNGGNGEFKQGNPWYQIYVDYAVENGLVNIKYSDYNAKITRANFAYILAGALPESALDAINDISEFELYDVADDYRRKAICSLYRAGVISGSDEFGTFKPDSTITRAEVAAIVTRMADKSQRKSVTLKKKATPSEKLYRAALAYANITFMNTYGINLADALDKQIANGVTGEDILRSQAFSLISEFEAVRLFAIDNGLEFTDAELKELQAAKNQQYLASGGKDMFISALNADGLNEEFFNFITDGQAYYNKLSKIFAMDGKYGMNSEEASKILMENYVRVKHILIQATPDSDDYDAKKTLARKVAQRAAKGESFEALIKEYGEDPGMSSNPDGYLFDKYGYTPDGSQMVAEFTNASVALTVGSVSDVVTTSYGFHIIKRYPINKEFVSSFLGANEENFTFNAFSNTLSAYVARVVITNEKELEAIDVASVFGK